ncbi:hypothetical protein B0T26DRAFT_643506 [Lasiosphaeria miniovina]|uniref:Zonadhesin n=1 Tax=Lasiosphaeria miniovina TaxID=1954250 RepID=A0AA40ATA8_9PEZI|nr:uncharacterized protein B0T26DRAFT_643506 [Lasiosphaeria miniovina]KAK0721572.1 hypothetical protein B0T26DRAFT_643506 [Lasiosphaeria miniovina]
MKPVPSSTVPASSSIASYPGTTAEPVPFLPPGVIGGSEAWSDPDPKTKLTGDDKTKSSKTAGFVTDTSKYGEPGEVTVTKSIPPNYTPSPKHPANPGPISLPSSADKLIVTATVPTTRSAVVTTVARLTTVKDVVATVTGTTTLKNIVVTVTGSRVSSFTSIKTLAAVAVTGYEVVATIDGGGGIVAYETAPAVVTLTGANGMPTATVTRPPFSTPTVVTLFGADGAPTATITTSALATPIVTTLRNSAGVPTATVTEYPVVVRPSGKPEPEPGTGTQPPAESQIVVEVYSLSRLEYFIGFFLPPILSVMLTIPVRMIDLAAKQYQPWHALAYGARRGGAAASESLCLRTGGIHGVSSSMRSLAEGSQAPLVFLTTLLTICSVAIVTLSPEAIALKLHGSCSATDFRGCAMTLGVFLAPARAVVVLLAFMTLLIVLILLVLLRRWRSGVAANPWTIAGVAALATNPDVRALFASLPTGRRGRVKHSELVKALTGHMFVLGHFVNDHGVSEYGVMIREEDDSQESDGSGPGIVGVRRQQTDAAEETRHKTEHHLPFLMLSYKGRAAFLVLLTGLMVVILYYNNTWDDTPFEQFMDTSSFGVRALFTLVGICITFFWSSFFTSMAVLSPYQLLSQGPQPAGRSVVLSPPLNAFSGILSAARRRHRYLVTVAFTAILSEFLPLLLSNVPFRVTQTWMTHMVCTWLAMAILTVMWLVVAGGFLVKWPHLPVDPSTIAGAMFYVHDSSIICTLEGLGALGKKERDRRVVDMRLKYEFGDMAGLGGRKRIGVDGSRDDRDT